MSYQIVAVSNEKGAPEQAYNKLEKATATPSIAGKICFFVSLLVGEMGISCVIFNCSDESLRVAFFNLRSSYST